MIIVTPSSVSAASSTIRRACYAAYYSTAFATRLEFVNAQNVSGSLSVSHSLTRTHPNISVPLSTHARTRIRPPLPASIPSFPYPNKVVTTFPFAISIAGRNVKPAAFDSMTLKLPPTRRILTGTSATIVVTKSRMPKLLAARR